MLIRALQILLWLVIQSITLSSCAVAHETTVERQETAVRLEPGLHLLKGESRLTLAAGAKRLTLRLSPGATVERVAIAGQTVPFTFTGGVLAIPLPTDRSGGTLTVAVNYRAIFDDPVPDRPLNDEDPTFGVSATITGRGVYLGSDAGWYPLLPTPPGHRTTSIEAPAGIEAVTAGRRDSRITSSGVTRSTWTEEHPTASLSLSAGPYQVAERMLGDIPIYTYLYPGNASLAPRYLDAAARHIRFYSELIGPYPFEKFAVVENFFPTGYGFASYTLLGSAVIRLPFIIDTSLPHEIVHNWWGNGVLPDSHDGNWSEALTTYLADYLLKERASPSEGREARFQDLADYASLVPPDRDFPLREFSGRVDPTSRAIGYQKGAMVFHMLRRAVGDQAFFGALADLCRDRLYRTATWEDFGRAFSRRADKDLLPFMRQWLVRPEGPRLTLADVKRQRENGTWRVSGTIVQEAPPYELSLPVRLETAGGTMEYTIPLTGVRTPFSFSSPTQPARLALDPDLNLFRLLSPGELPPTVNSIKGSRTLTAVITENCRASRETVRLLLKSLGQGEAPLIDERELSSASDHRDLLFCGVPQRGNAPKPPENISYSPQGFAVDGSASRDPSSLLFLVTPSRTGNGKVAALFLPLSEEAAARYLLKIGHYGRYSYVAFTGAENRLKGTLPAPAGASSAEFPQEPVP
ncbi:M1 family metallopeptidase [Geobacter sp. SVR]|uniref:M1 family metallopeptidase n=1 Tax=Geobacter sp. SVR TaxID=2495594 RepID=UPI00143F0580|nr:M1 family aminopeptidase [Geobacter sp. SVR]BCS52503.1 peptidase M1 [Geobacter sp. SVR]GCF84060.1 peptidase M1 [Geobacter sp. SVR]